MAQAEQRTQLKIYRHNLTPDTARGLWVKESGGPYYRQLRTLCQKFYDVAQRTVPLNYFLWRMAEIIHPRAYDPEGGRGYTTGRELYDICRKKAWDRPDVFPQ